MAQYADLKAYYAEHFLPIVKTPLLGQTSDGDSRRRAAAERLLNSQEGERFRINHDNFTLSGRIDRSDDGTPTCLNICSQDWIHDAKKLSYPLDHATRRLCLGGHTAHMNDLLLVKNEFSPFEHGLREEDVIRRDRQNFGSAQRLFFPRVQSCLARLENGAHGNRHYDVKGTRVYLHICFMFVEIYCSQSLSLYMRVVYASCVANFLRIWRWWVHRTAGLNLKDNFLTRQCYTDVLISCHSVVLHIKAAREFTPNTVRAFTYSIIQIIICKL